RQQRLEPAADLDQCRDDRILVRAVCSGIRDAAGAEPAIPGCGAVGRLPARSVTNHDNSSSLHVTSKRLRRRKIAASTIGGGGPVFCAAEQMEQPRTAVITRSMAGVASSTDLSALIAIPIAAAASPCTAAGHRGSAFGCARAIAERSVLRSAILNACAGS